jgi:transcriptional regulator with XRE-family HTH domain
VIVVITNVLAFPRPITFVNTFGNRLRHVRMLRKLTQAELARACGLSQGAIGNYESDSRRNAKDVFRIAEALEVEPAWLAMGTGPMERATAPHVADSTRHTMTHWPFPGIEPSRIWALSADQRQMLAAALVGMVSAMEDSRDIASGE